MKRLVFFSALAALSLALPALAQQPDVNARDGRTLLAQAAPPRPLPGATATPGEMPVANLDPALRKQIDDFFAALKKHEVSAAYDQLVKGTRIAERAEDMATLKSTTQQAIEAFGDIQGHEFLTVKTVGTHLLNVICLSLGKDFPLRWRFYYYKS